eukprot:TRINITY_DN2585_c0_g1_i1.p2 TRINITY_DN2585_c0_g1~~TRINITY_DN2585_c0_g1_i1.p2  ORF type:complete len:149 (+),score=28.33 TRINITY_DN2585_c0_g1_i1:308-754(+)
MTDICKVSETVLKVEEICAEVGDPTYGAISTFIGVTRNHHNGKKVLKLFYEAYAPMAVKEMHKICHTIRERWDVGNVAMYHKVGEVPIGEASVIIAISSVHRLDGLEAVHFAIDELKASVPVWKKEYYEDGSVWKGNAECRHHERKHK